jgi:PEGA domain
MLSFRLGAAGCLCLFFAELAFAQPAKLTQRFQEGVDAYRLGEYAEARVHLEAARKLDPKLPGPHRFLAAVALAEKRHADCIDSAATALRVAPQSRELEDTRKLHDECRIAAGRPTFAGAYREGGGALAITATFEEVSVGAAITIDGKASGSTPLYPRAIAAGPHKIKVSRAGAGEQTVQIDVLPGVVTDVAVVLGGAQAWLELPAELISGTPAIAITIDGKPVEPAARIAAPPGKRAIVVRRGKAEWSRIVEISAAKPTKLSPTFPAPKKAR